MKQKYFSSDQLSEMEISQRVHFINSLGGFKSVSLIGTSNYFEQTNFWISLKKFSKEISLLIGCVLFLLTFFPVHPTLLIVLTINGSILILFSLLISHSFTLYNTLHF